MVAALLEGGAAVDTVDGCGATALMKAGGSAGGEVTRLLLDAGADASLKDKLFGYTALELARHENRPAAVALLEAR